MEMKRIQVEINKDEHQELKSLLASRGENVADAVREALRRYLKDEYGKVFKFEVPQHGGNRRG